MSDININLHSVFHDCLDESDRLKFLIAEVSNLTLEEQATLVLEAFTTMQDYIDMKKMCVEVLGDDDDIITTLN